MKLKRQKHSKKVLSFYRNNFGFRPPYHVLVDGTFCKAALKYKVNIMEQMPKYFDGEVKLSTTKCVLKECEALGSLLYGPLKVLQQYTVEKCGHKPVTLPTKCIAKIAKKQENHQYFVATQDRDLSERIHATPGIPRVFISHGAIVLEPPTELAQQTLIEKQLTQIAPTVKQEETLKALKRQAFGEPEKVKKKKRKGPKGANPLSCKKKKKQVIKVQSDKTGQNKRSRHRRRKTNNSA